jgi:chemotaxis protein CheZ
VQQKRYRIESFLGVRPSERRSAHAFHHARVRPDADAQQRERAAAELAAAMETIEKACAQMLGTAEHVEEHARSIADAAKSKKTRALASDIQARIAQLYELCNFQDVAGQRIAKVIRLLTGEPESDAAGEQARSQPSQLINGPRLDGAAGHVTQDDVDALFGYKPA